MTLRLVTEYHELPGHCFFTGSADTTDGVIDFDRHVDMYGRVYMRRALGEELAALLGWRSPEEYAALEDERDTIAGELEQARDALESLQDLHDAQAKVEGLAASLAS